MEVQVGTILSVTTVATFDAAAGEHPENVVLTPDGTLYVSLHRSGRLWQRRRNGVTKRFTLPGADAFENLRFNGLALTADQRIVVAVRATDAEAAGNWELADDEQLVRRVALPATAGLNGLALDEHGTLYVADDTAGRIWRADLQTGQGTIWLADDRLVPHGPSPYGFPRYGANGVKLHQGALYASNSSTGRMWRSAIEETGAPGPLEPVHPHVAFHNIDDFAFDDDNSCYFTTVVDHTVECVYADGSLAIIATQQDGLDMPTAVTIDGDDPACLYVTNAAFYAPTGHTGRASLMRFTGMGTSAPAGSPPGAAKALEPGDSDARTTPIAR